MSVQRFDRFEIQATKTPEGFIQDSPIVGRVGILTYLQSDGSVRRELRPPEEAFNADSLASLKGKPVTIGHPGLVHADNVKDVQPIGTVLTEGKQDGNNIRADMVIYNLDTKGRELSCGYTLDTEETPGEWEGQHYDAIQKNIRYNHVAVVPKGRAGPMARLNMDGAQIYEDEEDKKTMKIRLDNGLEYDAAPEVSVAFEKLKQDNADLAAKNKIIQTNLDTTEAERDTLKTKIIGHEAELKKVKEDAAGDLDAKVKARVQILKTADQFGIEKADELTDRQIKEAVIKKARNDDALDLTKKSDEYISAAFDFAMEDAGKREDSMAAQRKAANTPKKRTDQHEDEEPTSAAEARQRMIDQQHNAYQGGKN